MRYSASVGPDDPGRTVTKLGARVRRKEGAYRIGALAAAACVSLVFVAACSRSSPTAAAGGQNQNHVFGVVTDGVRRPLAGAIVRVLDGPMTGTTLMSNAAGRFELFGAVAGPVTLQVTREGFKSATHTAQWQAAIQGGIDVIRLESLELSAIQLDPGAYGVTISMDRAAAHDHGPLPPCAGFPAELMSRSYSATIARSSHAGADRSLSLEGPTVFSNSEFELLIGGQFVGFENDYAFTEELPGFRYVNIIGNAPTDQPASVSGAAVSVPFNALFQYCELKSPATRGWENCQHVPAEQIVQFHACASDSARMVFTRR
jgi:hypothetical protein